MKVKVKVKVDPGTNMSERKRRINLKDREDRREKGEMRCKC